MPPSKIGILKENSLHAEIKNWYRQENDYVESNINGYLIDIVRNDTLIEVQTSHFYSVREKLSKLLPTFPIRVVYPIPVIKWVTRYDSTRVVVLGRRRSPKQPIIHSVFNELVYIPEIIVNKNFSLEILLVEQEDVWINDGKGSWRRKYWSVADRILLHVLDRIKFFRPQDYCNLLPAGLPDYFTTRDISNRSDIPRSLAVKMLNCLRKMNQVEIIGKENRAYLYSIVSR